MRIKYGLFIILALLSFNLNAAEYSDGQLRLVIHEATGRFSLYSLETGTPQALFSDRDPRTSFLSVMVNDRSYKLGDTFSFRIRLEQSRPLLTFESPFMIVSQEFSFVRVSSGSNGVRITITMENRGDRSLPAGARFLLDTSLGEGLSATPIATGRKTISSETLITRYDGDGFWKDSNGSLSISGSLNTGSPEDPDSVHIANWKKLADVTWKAPYQQGRNFNAPPYSVRDTAVCYYFEPRSLGPGERRTMAFTLAMNHEGAFEAPQTASAASFPVVEPGAIHSAEFDSPVSDEPNAMVLEDPATINPEDLTDALPPVLPTEPAVALPDSKDNDLAMLRALQERIDEHIAAGTGTDGELSELELALGMLRAKYGLNYRQGP